MAYTKTTWVNSPSETTPISAENLNNIENGIKTIDTNVGDTSTLTTTSKEVVGAINELDSNSVIVSATEPTGDDRKKNWFQKGINLFDGKSELGSISTTTGLNETSETIYRTINYLQVVASTNYIVTAGITVRYFFYNSSYTFISTSTTSSTFTTPSTCKYVRMQVTGTFSSTFQIEQGSTASTYEAYVEQKTWILNDNDVYEVFKNKINDLKYEYIGQCYDFGSSLGGVSMYRLKGTQMAVVTGYATPNGTSQTGNLLLPCKTTHAVIVGTDTGQNPLYLGKAYIVNATSGVSSMGLKFAGPSTYAAINIITSIADGY